MLESFSLKNKVVVITGGTGVLGKCFVNTVADAGGIVVIIGRNEERGNERVKKIKLNTGEAIFIKADVLDEGSLINAKNIIIDKYKKIDCLVNAAGGNIPESIVQPSDDVFSISIDGMKKAMDLNLWGTLIPIQVFGKEIAKTGKGSIVNISSVSSKQAITKVLGYSMGKASIDCLTKWFAVELAKRYGDGIRMNSIMPGFF